MTENRLNVVCIVADDLGWRDLGCYGSSFYETPHLDRLAQEGARFTDAYAAAPVCSPTRASIMTGQYPARVGITNYIAGEATGKLLEPEYNLSLPEHLTTIAGALGEAQYDTWHVGKWHLGGDAEGSLPTDRGFETTVAGCSWGAPKRYFGPWGIPTLPECSADEGRYLPDRLGAEAVSLIEDHDPSEEPFFLHYCPYLVHIPLEAPEESIERYERKRQSLGLDDEPEFELGDRFPAEHKKDNRIKRRLVQSDPVYAAMVESLDRNVGNILDALERTGHADDTVVVFTSDNGGLATAEGSPTTNRPLAEGKGWMEEGGNRVPLLVRWPGVTDETGSPLLVDEPAISPDVFATILEAANVDYPSHQPCDGVSLRPALAGESLDREAIYWHYPHYGNQGGTPRAAIRVGDWKLIEWFEDDHVELYQLDEDVGEAHDLRRHRPEKTAELRDRLHAWQAEVDAARPSTNTEYEPWPDRAGP